MNSSLLFSQVLKQATVVVCLSAFISPSVAAKTAQEIAEIAKKVTVQINAPDFPGGSGILFGKQGDTYLVLTANHVVISGEREYTVSTGGAKRYPIQNIYPLRGRDVDLAVVTFTSSSLYSLATLGDSNQATEGSEVYVAGFPVFAQLKGEDRTFEFSDGIITGQTPQRRGGYTLRYNATTKTGMSGGPVFDSEARIIGIHGEGDVEEGPANPETGTSVRIKSGFNAAIPINTFVDLKSQINLKDPVTKDSPENNSREDNSKEAKNSGSVEKSAALPSSKDPSNPISQTSSEVTLTVDSSPSTAKPANIENPETAKDFNIRGLVLLDQGKNSDASLAFDQSVALDPQDPDTYYYRGISRYSRGIKQGAIEDFTEVIDLDPEFGDAYYQRGVAHYETGNIQAALTDFDQAIRFSPTDVLAYRNRAIVRRSLEDYQGMHADLQQVVDLAPAAWSWYNLAIAKRAIEDREGSVDAFTKALNYDPNFVEAYVNRAIVRRRGLGDLSRAIEDLNQALVLEPDHTVAQYTRGLFRRDTGDLSGALEDLKVSAAAFQAQGETLYYEKATYAMTQIQAIQEGSADQQLVQPEEGGSEPKPEVKPRSQSGSKAETKKSGSKTPPTPFRYLFDP